MSLEQRTLGSPQSSREEAADPEPQAQADRSVVLVSRKTVYTIVAVLGVTMLGCTCALAFSLSNYNILKRNDEDVRSYIASRTKLVDRQNGSKSVAVDAQRTTAEAPVQTRPAERNEPRLDMRALQRLGDSNGQPLANGSLPEAARQKSFHLTAKGVVEEDEEPAAAAAADYNNATAGCCAASSNVTEDGFAEAP